MDTLTTTRLKNRTLTLPANLAKVLANKELLILVENNRLIVQPLDKEWDEYEAKLTKKRPKVTAQLIDEAVRKVRSSRR